MKIESKEQIIKIGDRNNIGFFQDIRSIDGFLIGGASKSSKNFIDIIKNFYK